MRRESIVKLIDGLIKAGESGDGIVSALEHKGLLTASYGSQDVSEIVSAFQKEFNMSKVSKWDRYAASRMAKTYSVAKVCLVIMAIKAHQGENFCPVINSITDMERKWNSILAFLQRNVGIGDTIDV